MSQRIFIATRKGLFRIKRPGADPARPWTIDEVSFLGDAVTLVLPDPRDGSLYAALEHGHFGPKLHRSTDGGDSWTPVAVPVYPPQPEGAVETDANGKPLPWKLELIWALEAGHPSEPGVLWAGTVPGGLFRSADRGASWTLVRSLWDDPRRKNWMGGGKDLPGIHSILVDPRDARRITLAVSCGGVWRSEDGGESWELRASGMRAPFMPPEREFDPGIQDVHRLVQCAAAPDRWWAQHHSGVYTTADAGRTWREVHVEPSSFGFTVGVHPKDADVAWFVPAIKDELRVPVGARVVVSRTDNGGASFVELRHGLPAERAYDLVYRHGLDVDDSGERLCFGSTTGSAWVSEDRGESWSVISNHLPPINCVRFAR
jgi:hypothetical protein